MRHIIAILLFVSVLAPLAGAIGAQDLMAIAGDDEIRSAINQADQAYNLNLSAMEKRVVVKCFRGQCPYMRNPRIKEKTNELMEKYAAYQFASAEDKVRLGQEMRTVGEQLRKIMPRLKQKLAQDIVKRTKQLTPDQRQRLKQKYPKAAAALEKARNIQITRRINVYEITDPESGTTDEFTFITLQSPEGGTLMEIVPKEVASDASLIFSEQPFTVVEVDPIIEWDIQAGAEVTYSVPGDKSASVTDDPAIMYEKGGDMTMLVIGAVVAIAIIGAIIFFAGGAAFLAKKKDEEKPTKKADKEK